MKAKKGFVLIITTVIISIMALLLLFCLQGLGLYHRVLNRQEAQHQLFYQLEQSARKLIKSVHSLNKTCVLQQNKANQIIKTLVNGHGCSLQTSLMNLLYYIEDLGEYPCPLNSTSSTHHFRLTILAPLDAERATVAEIIQIRFIEPEAGQLMCAQTTLGISSWRHLLV